MPRLLQRCSPNSLLLCAADLVEWDCVCVCVCLVFEVGRSLIWIMLALIFSLALLVAYPFSLFTAIDLCVW